MLAKGNTTEGVGTDKAHVTSGAVKSVGRREVRKPETSKQVSRVLSTVQNSAFQCIWKEKLTYSGSYQETLGAMKVSEVVFASILHIKKYTWTIFSGNFQVILGN